jgi:hypothetical protein
MKQDMPLPSDEHPGGEPEEIFCPGEEIDEEMADVALVERMGACSIDADYVEVYQSAVVTMRADDVDMTDSVAAVIIADDVAATNSCAFLVVAADVEGEITSVFTPMTAAIFGGAMGAVFFLLSQLFRPRR